MARSPTHRQEGFELHVFAVDPHVRVHEGWHRTIKGISQEKKLLAPGGGRPKIGLMKWAGRKSLGLLGRKSLRGAGTAWAFLLRVTTRGFLGELGASLGRGLRLTVLRLWRRRSGASRWIRLKAFVRFKANPALSRPADGDAPPERVPLVLPYQPRRSPRRPPHPPTH